MISTLRKLKLRPVMDLGCGDEGCAYLLDNGRVAKVSRARNELSNAQIVMLPQIQSIAMSQRIYLVKQLDMGRTEVTVTVREALDDVFDEDSDEYWIAIHLKSSCLDSITPSIKDEIVQGDLSVEDFVEKQADCIADELESILLSPPPQIEGISRRSLRTTIANVQEFVDQLLRGVAEYADYGIFLKDLQPSNFGVREDGQLVVRDLGCYEPRGWY